MGNYVFNFSYGSKEMKHLLGGKGANLAEMTKIGICVPPGFTISTEACNKFYSVNQYLWPELLNEINVQLNELENTIGKKFGCSDNPLLVSVRSGAVASMPGMMDTILNLGLNDLSVEGLAKSTNNKRFAYDSYRRFIQMFSDVVMGIPKYKFERIIERIKEEKSYKSDLDLTSEDLQEIVLLFKSLYKQEMKSEFPSEPKEQLLLAIEAVFKSWNNSRAIIYRKIHDIKDNLGTAVNIQSMVFGNMGNKSGTGVAFTRNPNTGENILFGEFLVNAQGEDVVAGIRTPQPIESLKDIMPNVYEEFINVTRLLEKHYKDMQDIEFTIENEKLYILQTRSGKRSAKAAINIAIELVEEKIISKEEAVLRVEPKQLDQILHPTFEEVKLKEAKVIAKGLPASPGAATGRVYFNAEDIVKAKERYEDTILVRNETSPEDIEGMVHSEGILTAVGGMTSHAAVVARGMGKCCIVGCSELYINEDKKFFKVDNLVINQGDYISIDGSTGNVYLSKISKVDVSLSPKFETFMKWIDEIKVLKVRTNADTPKDALTAVKFGAEGIGLCRTEHMFFDEKRISVVREMILSKSLDERQIALNKLLPMQREDFTQIFKAMEIRPCTIRLLDPPLHEFLPKKEDEIRKLAMDMNISFDEITRRIQDLHEFNPMLGHRGCRLAITYPEIYEMQTKAIIEAAISLTKEGLFVKPEIMIPLIGDLKEFKYIKDNILKVINNTLDKHNVKIEYLIGTMIEVPRAALIADEIAKEAEFFSFGTNDLTQMTYGFSRDDSNKFLKDYKDKQIFDTDPFQTLDQHGVGKLIDMAVRLGKNLNNLLKLGICGEHGGDPKSIEFCSDLGLDYVSCSPYRVPIAKLAAAQAVLKKINFKGDQI